MDEIKVNVFRRTGRKNWYMQYRDPVTGDKVTQSAKTTRRRDADRAAARWEKELEATGGFKPGRISWEDFRERYEEEAVSGLADKTAKKIEGVLDVFERIAKPQRLGDVNGDMLSRYKKALRDMGRAESTIASHLAHIRAALSWAVDEAKLLLTVPKVVRPKRAKRVSKITPMKGRPITAEEFERMLTAVPDVLTRVQRGRMVLLSDRARAVDRAPSWQHLLRGFWWSGLRLSEALELHWTDRSRLCLDLSFQHPMLRIPAEMEKGHKDRLLPLAPEFAQFLLQTPERQRAGFVFNPAPEKPQAGRLTPISVGRTIAAIGAAACVKVDSRTATDNETGDRVTVPKFASAHDLRRSFGERWAVRVMPEVLQELMRHESIETTLRYYVGRNAQRTAAVLWEAFEKAGAGLGDTLGDTQEAAVNSSS